jgi:hypothetical protein
VGVSSTAGLPWAEVDDPTDLNYARVVVGPGMPGAAPAVEPNPAFEPAAA